MAQTEPVKSHSRALASMAAQLKQDDAMLANSSKPEVQYGYHLKELRKAIREGNGRAIQYHRKGMAIAVSEGRSLQNLAKRQQIQKIVASIVAQKAR